MRALLILLLTSCTTTGQVLSTVGLASASGGTALIVTSDRSEGQLTAGVVFVALGAYTLLAAMNWELSQPDGPQRDGVPAASGESFANATQDGEAATEDEVNGGVFVESGAVELGCRFGNCATNGASGRTATGEYIETRCKFGNCATDGWTTTTSSGSSDTRCKFGDCTKDGWTTTSSSGSSETRCKFGDCTKDGWTTTTPSGSSETRCRFGDCNKNGWTTTSSDGSTVDCSCKFGDCQANGVECR